MFCSKGTSIHLRKTEALENGSARVKAKSAPMSASLFWMGVPVRHHRELA
jgi:hypothetical protein